MSHLARLFDSLLPLQNPIGFGAADFLELALAAILAALALAWRPWIEPRARRLAPRTAWCMAILAVLPVALRLILLPHHPVPTPNVYDEFSHLFVADTLRHFRLANPPHILHQFFETTFILQQPSYSSIYPIGQGLILAIGWAIFGLPWAGVLLATAAFCALCYWMLRGWTTPMWALAGGLLAVIEFGPLCSWMNSYWGGELGAAAGCLVFGALPRLKKNWRVRDAVWLGLGLALHFLIRPYESIFLVASVCLFLVPALWRKDEARRLLPRLPIVVAGLLLAGGVTLVQNKQVTGRWLMLPYQLSQYQYGVPAALTFQSNPVPHLALTPQQELQYKAQAAFRASGPETIGAYLQRLEYRIPFYRFFFLPPLYLALLAFLVTIRSYRWFWAALTLALFALGINFFPAFQTHYLAGATCLFVLVSVAGLRQIGGVSKLAASLILFLCVFHFSFWYSMHVFETQNFSIQARQYETWDGIDQAGVGPRILVNQALAGIPGKLLVFVRYWPMHMFQQEWVYNAADIDGARVVWARDLGEPGNQKLRDYYPHRSVWLLEPDATPPRLSPYQPAASPQIPPPQPPGTKKKSSINPELKLLNVK